jgi:hypothetical protein
MGGALCEPQGPHATSDRRREHRHHGGQGADMGFVQIIDFTTSRYDDLRKVEDEWTAATEGIRTTPRWMIGKDRDRLNHYVEVVEFPSYAEAMKNNDLPQTKDFSQRIAELCDDVTFYNIDDVETFEP